MCEIMAMTKRTFSIPADLAKALRDQAGLSASYASEIASGQRTPSLALAVKIEGALGIPPAHWIDRAAEAAARRLPANDTTPSEKAA